MKLLAAGLFASMLSAGGLWLDVPYVKQQREGCGSAAISMVIRYWIENGSSVSPQVADPERIQRELHSREARGIFASDIIDYFRNAGFQPFAFRAELADLEHHLASGRPLIVALKENARGTALHYVVVAGIDRSRDVVLVNDPARRKLLAVDRDSFSRNWKDNWTLLALPKPK